MGHSNNGWYGTVLSTEVLSGIVSGKGDPNQRGMKFCVGYEWKRHHLNR